MGNFLNLALYGLLRFCLRFDLGRITSLLPVELPCYRCRAPLTGRRQHLYAGAVAYYFVCYDCRPDLAPPTRRT